MANPWEENYATQAPWEDTYEQPQAHLLDRLGRQAGLTGRYLTEAATGLGDLIASPVRGAMNAVLPEQNQIRPMTDVVQESNLLPKPANQTERLVGDVSRAVASTGMTMGGAGLAKPISQAGKAIQSALTSNAPTQLASAVTGGGAAGMVREGGGGAIPQAIAGVLGSLGGAGLVKPQSIGKSTEQILNAPKDKLLSQAQKAGYVALPSQTGGGKLGRTLETFSGKFKAEELASAKNQQVTNNLTRKYLGVDDQTPLTTDTLTALRESAGDVYQTAASLPAGQVGTTTTRSLATGGKQTSPVFKTGAELIEELKLARDDARAAWKSLSMGTDKPTQVRASAKAADARAEALENQLENLAKQNNQPDLVEQLRQARKEIAKIYTVEKATNPVTGMVDAKSIAKQLDKNVPLSGDLALVAKFAKTFPKVNKPVTEMPNPFSIYDVAGGSFGVGAGNPLLMGLPLVRAGSRYAVTSNALNPKLSAPTYNSLTKPFVPYQGLLGTDQ